ncbi:MAG TPA: L-lactate permease [Blastocatellia bacterium]|nr:L-lactate permease [Blastocatellia bacterium]
MTWTQVYDPFGAWWLSTLVAALPIVVLLGLVAVARLRPHVAAAAGAASALLVACVAFQMPWKLGVASFLFGAAFGLLRIAWIVVCAVFLYDVSVKTGQFDIMKQSIAAITPDRRLQVLLVAFCFGALIEGAAGFGAPVAIAGAFMIGLGFEPFHAAVLNLIANTAPVAWGAIGTPVHTLAAVSGLPESDVSATIGRILPITAMIVPFWLIRSFVGWAETFEVLPAILVVGISFASAQFLWSNKIDSNLVDIASAVTSLTASVIFLRFWKPKRIWKFARDSAEAAEPADGREIRADLDRGLAGATGAGVAATTSAEAPIHTKTQIARAWMPFLLLSGFVLVWGLPGMKTAMNRWTMPAFETDGFSVPLLDRAVTRASPVVSKPSPERAKFEFNWLSATGTGCLFAGITAGLLLGLGLRDLTRIFWQTLKRMRTAVLAISFMLGLGYITRYSGMDAVLGLAFTRTGVLFPFFGTFLGWLGVALTGSDTSSNALFGGLQRITAEQLRLDPILMCAANSAGGVMGKMIDVQSIVVATAATNQVGNEGSILRHLIWHSIALASIVGIIVLIYSYVFPGGVPHGLTLAK